MEEFHIKNQEQRRDNEYISEYGVVFQSQEDSPEGIPKGTWYLSLADGSNAVPVPEDVAEWVSKLLKIQEQALSEGDEDAVAVLKGMNCRISALVAAGAPLTEFFDNPKDPSGVEHLFSDVDRIQEGVHSAFVVEDSFLEIRDFLDTYEGAFPAIVHIFEVEKDSELEEGIQRALTGNEKIPRELINKLPRSHSFLVLGERDEQYICFEKIGPEIERPLHVAEFEDVCMLHRLTPGRTGVVFIGSVQS